MPIRRLRSAVRSFALLFAIAIPQTVLAQPAFLVKDINTTTPTQLQPIPSSLQSGFGFFWFGQDDFEEHGGKLLFAAAADADQWRQLWVSDGTPAGTYMVEETPNAFALGELTSTAGPTFFRTYTDLYRTDGTPEGTESLWSDSTPLPSNLVASGSSIFYVCSVPSGELCRSDGTPEGTGLVKDTRPPGVFFAIARLTMAGSTLFFVSDNGTSGRELFKSDGTEAGTGLVLDPWTGGESLPELLTDVNGTLFYSAFHPDTGRELWKSDGTAAGTVLVKNIRSGNASSLPEQVGSIGTGFFTGALGSTLFFQADDGTSGSELWKSDGTEAGTVRVKDVAPGSEGSAPSWFARLGNRIYFTADDGEHGRELWMSDGTEAGTRMVADLFPGDGSSLPQHPKAVGHVLLFSATDGVHGAEPWRTNGTASGTRMIQDIAPGSLASSSHKFTPAGSLVFFSANDNTTGDEPWAVPQSNVLATFSDVPAASSVWPYVEALAAAGITAGCAPGQFCPWGNVNRSEIAVFLTRGTRGPAFVPPPATGTVFADVPADYWAASWIEQFSLDGFTSGCGVSPLRYCPAGELTRAEMAIFLLRAKHGSAYTPPPATGTVFTDVPVSHWAASWIEQLAAEGVTAGCAPGLYCPGSLVTRTQMAIFLTRTFSLPLP